MPKLVWLIGFLQFAGGLLTELISMVFMSSFATPMDVIMKFIVLSSIVSIDNLYAAALPHENKVKKNFKLANPTFTKYRRLFKEEDTRTCGIKVLAFITKMTRIIYASWIFYFIPFFILFVPYVLPV